MSDNKDRLTYRPEPETKQKIERWYQVDNCRSKNEFTSRTGATARYRAGAIRMSTWTVSTCAATGAESTKMWQFWWQLP